MASFSTNLLQALLAQGESAVLGFANWGDAANSNFQFLEDALTDDSPITVNTADVTLTAAENRSLYLNCTGTLTGNRNVIIAARRGFWLVYNNTAGAFSLTFKTAAGSGVAVQQGKRAILYCDGTNVTDFVAIGTAIQAYDAGLQSIADLAPAADRMIYTTGVDVYASTALTPFARTLLDDAAAADVLTTLGVSAFVQTILNDADAAAVRSTIGAFSSGGGAISGSVTVTGDVTTGSGDTFVTVKADGGIEISRAAGSAHVDFKNSGADDYDIRIGQSGANLNIQTNGGGLLQVNGTRTILNDGGTHDIGITGTAANATLVGGSTAMTKDLLDNAGVPPAGFVRVLGLTAGNNYRILQIDTSTGTVTDTGTGW